MAKTDTSTLRLHRISAGMTQSTLAARAGVSQQLLSKLEAGKIAMTPDRAQQFAAILGCHALDLLPAFADRPVPEGLDETELIRVFRALDARDRACVLQMARVLLQEKQSYPRSA